MCSRQHNSTENDIDQTNANKPQIQTNINAYINNTITQQIKFNPYQKHNDKEIQRNKKKTPIRQTKLNIKNTQSTITTRQNNQYKTRKYNKNKLHQCKWNICQPQRQNNGSIITNARTQNRHIRSDRNKHTLE